MSIFQNYRVVQHIFKHNADNSQLAVVNKFFNSVARNNETKSIWIINRPDEISIWQKSFEAIEVNRDIFSGYPSWLSFYLYSPPTRSAIEKLLNNHNVIEKVLIYFLEKQNYGFVWFFWKLLASKGSLLGVKLIQQDNQEYLCSQIDLIRIVFYPAIFQANCGKKDEGMHALKFLSGYHPTRNMILEMINDALRCANKELVEFGVGLESEYNMLFSSMGYAMMHNIVDSLDIMLCCLNEESIERWKLFVAALRAVEVDDIVTLQNYITVLYESMSTPSLTVYFNDALALLVEKSVRSKSFKCLDLLFNEVSFSEAEIFVSLSTFGIPLIANDEKLCSRLISHLDCTEIDAFASDRKMEVLLQKFCISRQFTLFLILYPFSDINGLRETREYVEEYQLKIAKFLVSKIKELKNDYTIPSSMIWTAFTAGNKTLSDELVKLGGVAQWMDSSNSTSKNSESEKSKIFYEVDDKASCIFRGYCGDSLIFYDPTLINASHFEEYSALTSLKGAEYANTMRKSVRDLEVIQMREIMWENSVPKLGGRRSSVVKVKGSLLAGRVRPYRKPSSLQKESDQYWIEYMKSSGKEAREMLNGGKLVDWMESHNDDDFESKEHLASSTNIGEQDEVSMQCALY